MVALTKFDKAALGPDSIRNDTFVQRLFLTWVYGVINKGRKGKLKREELRMPSDQATEVASAKFDAAWKEELKYLGNTDPKGRKPSLLRALLKAFGFEFFIAGCWKSAWSVLVLLGAFYFVRSLVQFVSDPVKFPNIYNTNDMPNNGVGWILACTFFIDSVLVGSALQRMGDTCVRVGIKIRAALMTSIFRKTFNLPSVHNEGAGNVVSLVSTDCSKIYEGVQHVHNVWTAPLEAAAIIALLLSLTQGIYGLPALGVVVFVLPLQYYFGYRMAKYKLETVEVSDARVLRMQEVLLAIKLVKFYVWERSFSKQVSDVRDHEIKLMAKTSVIKILNLCLVFAVPPVIAAVIFATYVWNVGPFDSVFSFTVLSLFNTLRFPLVVLPKALRGSSEAIASLGRLQQFLLLQEAQDTEQSKVTEARLEDAVLVHPSNPKDFTLTVPRFEALPGEVVAIVGRVGSGKSSIFQAILKNMQVQQGTLVVGGTIGYVPQTPWVQNLSLKDNILFGLPYDEQKYRQIIHACALELDLQILPQGDQSMAGERGINLSGGQRQRVCLARAVYHDCDIVLLDNPLSAVDQHTAQHIFRHCIKGLLKDKAVIWITHQLELLPQCNKIGIMDNGNLLYFGPYDPDKLNHHLPVDHLLFATVEAGESGVAKSEKGSKADLSKISHSHKRKSFQRSTIPGIKPSTSIDKDMQHLAQVQEEEAARDAAAEEEEEEGTVMDKIVTLVRAGSLKKTSINKDKADKSHKRGTEGGAEADVIETPEEIARKFNGVPSRLSPGKAFYVYWKAGGLVFGVFCLFLFMITQTCRIYSDLWVRYWAADEYNWYPVDETNPDYDSEKNHASVVYMCVYSGMVALFIILLLSRDTAFSVWHIIAGRELHNRLFLRVLKAPILFFLRTPVGDILNSFAKDQDTLDETLPDTLHMSAIYLMILLTSLAIVTVSIHYYAALTAALFVTFGIMQFIYLPAATVLKRWAGETASMVYVHVDESLHGMEVIKAFDARNYFVEENVQRVNQHHLALFNTEQCHLWLAFWCDFFGAVLVVATCLFSVGLKDDLGPSPVGLAISNSIQVLVFFTWVVRGVADTVSMWDAVERITSFATNVPEEASIATNLVQLDDMLEGRPRGESMVINTVSTNSKFAGMGGHSKASSSQDLHGNGIKAELESVQVQMEAASPAVPEEQLVGWPHTGDIRFEKVCLRYYPGGPLALRHVSFHIQDKEKVGVVGRTGSGKTTLLMALFRMFELGYGRIIIDGFNIASVPLSMVRARIAIIPQEPVMFKGTVRSNLDPFCEAPDSAMWEALDMVHLKQAISELPGGLDAVVSEGGSNFSLGQKQLICMARCVIKPTRILVLDEATAAMDLQTDSLIQKTIRKVFKDRTTITIAHRLDTIIFSDKVLAMAAGQVREFDHPNKLLADPSSMFTSLVEDTGAHASAALRRMAAEGPQDEEGEFFDGVQEEAEKEAQAVEEAEMEEAAEKGGAISPVSHGSSAGAANP